jgi:hypothetical protein
MKCRGSCELLQLSAELHDTGDIKLIDATGMDRIAASKRYAKRTNYPFRAVKTTALIDCKAGAIPKYTLLAETAAR